MPSQNIMSLAIGRAVGKSAGVPVENLGRLSIVSYMLANPMLAMVAARSMAPKSGNSLAASGDAKPEPTLGAEEVKAAVDAAKVAAAAAGASEKNAEGSAVTALGHANSAKGWAEKAEAAAAKLPKG